MQGAPIWRAREVAQVEEGPEFGVSFLRPQVALASCSSSGLRLQNKKTINQGGWVATETLGATGEDK